MENWLLLQIQVGIVILIVLFLRQMMRRLPKIYSYALWLVVFLRLLCPWNIESPVSLIPSETHLETFLGWDGEEDVPQYGNNKNNGMALQTQPMWQAEAADQLNLSNKPDDSYAEKSLTGDRGNAPHLVSTPLSSGFSGVQKALIAIWVAGILAVWIYNFSSLYKIRRKLKCAVLLEENVWVSSAIRTPFVLGWRKPQIYLPRSLQDRELEYVLYHEKTHIRRKDYVVKNLAFLLTSVYWYHPLVWLAFYLLGQDMEMSCDEAVVKQLGLDIKKQYSQSLLNFASGSQISSATPLAFGENGVKQRIRNVLAYKNAKRWIGLIGIALVTVAGVVLLTTRGLSASPAEDGDGTIVSGGSLEGEEQANTSSAEIPEGNREIYEECQIWEGDLEGNLYQVTEEGIWEISPEGPRLVYSGYIGTAPRLQRFGDKLFFMINVTGAERDNFFYNGIGWINVKDETRGTLEIDENAPLTDLWVYNGFFQYRLEGEDAFSPDRHIFILPDDDEGLTQTEKMERGVALSRHLTENPGTLLAVGEHSWDQINACLDLDMDGVAEEIFIMRDPDEDPIYGYLPLDYYVLTVIGAEDSILKGHADNIFAEIYAVSLDGETVQLVLYEDGPSDDPLSHIFCYQAGQLVETGVIADDIRRREITAEGEIISHIRYGGIQDDYKLVTWQLNEAKELVEIPQDTYELVSQNEITLLTHLPVRSMPVPQEGIYMGIRGYIIEPQTVKFIAVSSDERWIQVEAEDGQQGWFAIEWDPDRWDYVIKELDLGAYEIFEGLKVIAG
ncbi:MAG: hypothetical protein J1E64_09700 [Acetatifactor sp.]|nr:hypothetical protein [Acetatifactor sp.]